MKGLTTCLWFDHQAEEAARFYTSIFKHARLGDIAFYGQAGAEASGRPKGSVMTVEFELAGQQFVALNGGPEFKFTEAVSITVNCENQKEVDEYWSRLTAGGTPGVCGWLKDKYGLSWQIVPTVLSEMVQDHDPARADRVMAALMGMQKVDIARLEEAYDGTLAETRG